MNCLRESLSLAGKSNQALNQLEKKISKLSYYFKFAKHVDVTEDSPKLLFADNISKSLDWFCQDFLAKKKSDGELDLYRA